MALICSVRSTEACWQIVWRWELLICLPNVTKHLLKWTLKGITAAALGENIAERVLLTSLFTFIMINKATGLAILTTIGVFETEIKINKVLKKAIMRNVSQTLFLRMTSEALSRDWMQADKASWDKPWKTALWKNTNKANKNTNG